MKNPRVLVADFDLDFQRELSSRVSRFHFIMSSSFSDVFESIESSKPDILLMNLYLEHKCGLDVFCEIRDRFPTFGAPTVFVAESSTGDLRASVFKRGAADFVHKPIYLPELFARFDRALNVLSFPATGMSNSIGEGDAVLELGNLVMDRRKGLVQVLGREVNLTLIEIELLVLFIKHYGQLLSRKEILYRIWKGTWVTNRTVDTHVSNLRKKLGHFNYSIRSRYGSGYILEKKKIVRALEEEGQPYVQFRY